MSFLRKLFRGDTQPLDGYTPAPPAEERMIAHAERQQVATAEAGAAPQLAEPAPPSPSTAAEPTPSADQPQAPADEERPWWSDAEPALAPDAEGQPTGVSDDVAPADAAPETGTVEHVDTNHRPDSAIPSSVEEDSTRPLTAADMPALVALRSRQGFAAAALRDIGRVRSVNQDSVFALTTTLPRESNDVSMGLFVVADGMGGHAGGEVASRLAISTIARYVLAELVIPALTDSVTEALQPLIVAAVQEANRTIWEQAQAIGSDMGTTCTVALLLGQALYMGHVGDSRAYLLTPTGLRLITSDHSAVGRLIQLGQLDSAEAREHPLRSQLYRTVGQHPEVQVDFIYQPIGDATHLLLCSDGLWSMLDEAILLDVLEQSIWPQDACRELIARANLAGGDDNISAIVVTLPSSSSQLAGGRRQH